MDDEDDNEDEEEDEDHNTDADDEAEARAQRIRSQRRKEAKDADSDDQFQHVKKAWDGRGMSERKVAEEKVLLIFHALCWMVSEMSLTATSAAVLLHCCALG